MNTTTRTCQSCTKYNPEPKGLDPACWIQMLFPSGEFQRDPDPTDCCELHSTSEEAAQALYNAYLVDPEIQEIVDRQLSGENELKHIADQAASEVITMQVLGKMRKGGAL